LFEDSPDGIVIVDAKGDMRLVNRQMELLFGYRREEMHDQPVEMLIPAAARERHEAHRAVYLADPRMRPMGFGFIVNGLHRDGREFTVEISLSPMVTREGLFTIATVRRGKPHGPG
jgi:PAS domain S-box-containing protein